MNSMYESCEYSSPLLLYAPSGKTPAVFVLIQYRSVTDGRTDISVLAIPALA